MSFEGGRDGRLQDRGGLIVPKVVNPKTDAVEVIAIEDFPVRKVEFPDRADKGADETLRRSIPPILGSLSKIGRSSVRRKPVYTDTWMVGDPDDLSVLERYDTGTATVVIGIADDGEVEYNITPNEYSYSHALDSLVEEAIADLRDRYRKNGGGIDRIKARFIAEQFLWKHEDRIAETISDVCDIGAAVSELSEVVHRHTIGNGIFDILLDDDRLEDVYVDAPCEKNRVHVTLSRLNGSNSHARCRTNLIVSEKEMRNLICRLVRDSGLPFCESNPVLETDMDNRGARATVVGFPMSPNGDSVAIRKHSIIPWTLTRLIGNGTIDEYTAGVLSFLVDNRCTFLVAGPRGAGKSALLSAMLFEFNISNRILTIEDTLELPGDRMRSMGYKVQSMLIDDRNGREAERRADEALRVSLRLGESAIVLGEVRGEEARTLYQSMSTGRAGSSILGTIHGDCARTVYNRVVNDLQIPKESFMETDFIVTMGTVKDRITGRMERRMKEFVSTTGAPGEFNDVTDFDGLQKSPAFIRIMGCNSVSIDDIGNEIEIRARLRGFLAEMAIRKGEGFYSPEWIVLANDHLSKSLSSGVTDVEAIVRSFADRFKDFSGESR